MASIGDELLAAMKNIEHLGAPPAPVTTQAHRMLKPSTAYSPIRPVPRVFPGNNGGGGGGAVSKVSRGSVYGNSAHDVHQLRPDSVSQRSGLDAAPPKKSYAWVGVVVVLVLLVGAVVAAIFIYRARKKKREEAMAKLVKDMEAAAAESEAQIQEETRRALEEEDRQAKLAAEEERQRVEHERKRAEAMRAMTQKVQTSLKQQAQVSTPAAPAKIASASVPTIPTIPSVAATPAPKPVPVVAPPTPAKIAELEGSIDAGASVLREGVQKTLLASKFSESHRDDSVLLNQPQVATAPKQVRIPDANVLDQLDTKRTADILSEPVGSNGDVSEPLTLELPEA